MIKMEDLKTSKETRELGEGIAKFIGEVIKATKDGWGQDDLTKIMSSAMADLVPAMQGSSNVKNELQDNPEAFYRTLFLALVDVVIAAGIVPDSSTKTIPGMINKSKELDELGDGLVKFIGKCYLAKKDGWSYVNDLPVVISSAVRDLLPALDGVGDIANELHDDKEVFAKTIGMILIDLLVETGVIKSGRSAAK